MKKKSKYKTKRVSKGLRMEAEMWDFYDERAKKDGRTTHGLIVHVLTQYKDQQGE